MGQRAGAQDLGISTQARQPMSKLTIGSIDEPPLQATAQYNPSEIVVDRPVSWTDHTPANTQTATAGWTEFAGMKPRTMKIDLLFDGFEHDGKLGQGASAIFVTEAVAILEKLASVRDPSSTADELRRPHFCVVAWAAADQRGMQPFRCVIDALSTKYSMFSRTGRVLRATCTVSLKEADRLEDPKKAKNQRR